ncbi:MAG: hypothetical protein ABSB65_12165 [Candidatus Acidiferrales bacterium]
MPEVIVTVLISVVALMVSWQALEYARFRDRELDKRNEWIEIHKAIINLRVYRSFALSPLDSEVWDIQAAINESRNRVRDYVLAHAHLRAQLERVHHDPLIKKLASFLDCDNKWREPDFEATLDRFGEEIAKKSRSKLDTWRYFVPASR